MTLNFCTLFDSNYMTRGLAMHQSLLKNCSAFHLYIFSFDTISFDVLSTLNLPHVTIISLNEFEDEELLKIKPTRTAAEYCWTCTPSTILYCIQKYHLDNCIYIDADLLFYSDPKVLVDEMENNSVLITEHRYSPEYDQTKTSGKYCVQFMCFKNNERGMTVLKWWRNACIEWCYARSEDGKFGDQKYLDDWTTRFEGVHELKHIGGGVAPWNVQQYKFKEINSKYFLKKVHDKEFAPLVFFHFHGLKFYVNELVQLSSGYYLSKWVMKKICFPYINLLQSFKRQIQVIDNSFDPNATKQKDNIWSYTWKDYLYIYIGIILKLNFKKLFTVYKEINSTRYFTLAKIKKYGAPYRP